MIKLIDCVRHEEDYIVTLERPDGSRLKVAIPREDHDGYFSKCLHPPSDVPYYLNFVTDRHYD